MKSIKRLEEIEKEIRYWKQKTDGISVVRVYNKEKQGILLALEDIREICKDYMGDGTEPLSRQLDNIENLLKQSEKFK